MSEQKFRVGQRVRVVDVLEGPVRRVERGFIYVDGVPRVIDGSHDPKITRTITILSEPKPDEPALLGAVVRDAEGDLWSRVSGGGLGLTQPWRRLGVRWDQRAWVDVDAVEVLFPGVEQ